MISTGKSLVNVIGCSACGKSLDFNIGQLPGREVVKTSCDRPHYYHLDCITPKIDALAHCCRRCSICDGRPLPLVRLSGVRLNEESSYCESLATYACRTGDLVQLKQLLADDADMPQRRYLYPTEQFDSTLLSIAARFGQIHCLQALINSGAGNQRQLNAALNYAAGSGHIECVKFLLNTGATCVNRALEIASERGHANCVDVLIDNGANSFHNALYFTAVEGHTECMRVLLSKGSPIETKQLNENLNDAAYKGNADILQLLIDHGANDLNQATWTSALRGHSESLRVLLRNGANELEEPLNGAAMRGHTECLRILMDSGANELKIALSIAEKHKRTECQQILREQINSQKGNCSIQ